MIKPQILGMCSIINDEKAKMMMLTSPKSTTAFILPKTTSYKNCLSINV
jgi:hypothetical protein